MKNPFGGMGDLSKMMQAAREMQDKVEGLQQSLDEITVIDRKSTRLNSKQETERLAGGMGLPPGMKLPF